MKKYNRIPYTYEIKPTLIERFKYQLKRIFAPSSTLVKPTARKYPHPERLCFPESWTNDTKVKPTTKKPRRLISPTTGKPVREYDKEINVDAYGPIYNEYAIAPSALPETPLSFVSPGVLKARQAKKEAKAARKAKAIAKMKAQVKQQNRSR